jgi:CRP/FNR family transcriptional regulator, nitrogen fixation regulation protein
MLMRPATAAVATQTPRYQFPRSGVDTNTIAGSMELMGTRISYPRNVEIFGEGESAEYLYKVVSGSVRSCRILDDGRRQVTGFYIVGEVFGLEHDEEHHFSAEAVNDTVILVVKRSAITGLAARDADIARQLWTMTARELQRVQNHTLVLGCLSAKQRVAAFLLQMALRSSGGDEVELPMSRQDIADYLGMTVETVSRTMTQLAHDAVISLASSRRIVLRNRAALVRLNA